MATGYKLWKDCEYCVKGKQRKSIAEAEPVEIDCPQCGGTGLRFWGWRSEDGFTLPVGLPEPE